jgi:hypothetical protein
MSSLVRRLEIRILKARDFIRQDRKVIIDPVTNLPTVVKMTPKPWPTNPRQPAKHNPDDAAYKARLARDLRWGRISLQSLVA